MMFGCSSSEEELVDDPNIISCVPKQEVRCSCGIDVGVQKCSSKGVLGKCQCEAKTTDTKDTKDTKDTTETTPSTSKKPTSTSTGKSPSEACEAVADAWFRTANRCSLSPATARDNFIKNAANGDCANVSSLRDEESLYGICIPSFETISCGAFQQVPAKLDPTCEKQFNLR